MTSKAIELTEQTPDYVSLTSEEARELNGLGLDVAIRPDKAEFEFLTEPDEYQLDDTKLYWVNPKSFVGHFRLSSDGSRVVSIRPKVPIRNLFAILGASYYWYRKDSPFRKLTVGYDVDVTDVIEPLVEMFNQEVRRILQDGLLKKYIETQEDCGTVKGRIVFSEQISRNLIHCERICCRFAQSEVDIPENQVILFSLLLLRRNSELSASVRQELTAHILHFGDVSVRQFLPNQVPSFTYDRLSQRYEEVHSWCRLFIDMMSLSEKPGENTFSGFLLDMTVLFERFVISMFDRASRKIAGVSTRSQEWRSLTIDGRLRIRPDLLIQRRGGPSIPVDAKYKRTEDPDKAKRPDIYQIVTYCSALGVIGVSLSSPQGLLVYPKSVVEEDAALTAELDIITKEGPQGPQSELKVTVCGLDLSSKDLVEDTSARFSEILNRLK